MSDEGNKVIQQETIAAQFTNYPKPTSVGIFMDFKQYKFPCTEVPNLLSEPRSHRPPTLKQVEKAINILNKENLLAITKTDVDSLVIVIEKYWEMLPSKPSNTMISYLCEVYCYEVLGINKIMQFQERSNRNFQINGTKNESIALDILSRIDGVKYEKNKKLLENEYFVGKPDVIHENSVIEIKTIASYPDFLFAINGKPGKEAQYQLQCYMDLVNADSGELIYVATGLHPDEYEKYIGFAKKWFLDAGVGPEKVEKRLKKLEKDCIFNSIPDSQKIKRYQFKKNPEMIKFAKKKVTAARNWLSKWDEKYNKLVALPDEVGEKT